MDQQIFMIAALYALEPRPPCWNAGDKHTVCQRFVPDHVASNSCRTPYSLPTVNDMDGSSRHRRVAVTSGVTDYGQG